MDVLRRQPHGGSKPSLASEREREANSEEPVVLYLPNKDGRPHGVLTFVSVHPLMVMRMHGWDLEMYKDGASPFCLQPKLTPEILSDMAGKMWSCSYVPIRMAAIGCINWKKAASMKNEYLAKKREAATKWGNESNDEDDEVPDVSSLEGDDFDDD